MSAERFLPCHPVVQLFYFVAAFGCTMLVPQPILLALSLALGGAYGRLLNGGGGLWGYLLLFLSAALVNPLFSHEGVTILGYLWDGNPLTLESIWYGLFFAATLVNALLWFRCYSVVMTSDRLIYLFGKTAPALALAFSMILGMIPRLSRQLRSIQAAQRGLGHSMQQGSMVARARNGLAAFSMLTTWALENGVDTADSMGARGYGLAGRTTFSIYAWRRRDTWIMTVVCLCTAIVLRGTFSGVTAAVFFPKLRLPACTGLGLATYGAFFLLLALPCIVFVAEECAWRRVLR